MLPKKRRIRPPMTKPKMRVNLNLLKMKTRRVRMLTKLIRLQSKSKKKRLLLMNVVKRIMMSTFYLKRVIMMQVPIHMKMMSL